jgi:Flp pilus assembly protein TadB
MLIDAATLQILSIMGVVLGLAMIGWGFIAARRSGYVDAAQRVAQLVVSRRPSSVIAKAANNGAENPGEQTPATPPRLVDILEVPTRIAERRHRLILRGSMLIAWCCLVAVLATYSLSAVIAISVLTLAIGYLAEQASARRAKREVVRQIDFFLPIVMERVVMAVEAGKDLMPALRSVVDVAESDQSRGERMRDPVSELVALVVALTEGGFTLETALKEVSSQVPSAALKHAFVHIAVAAQEGGELIHPLRELSDATQQYYQEQVEEEIATLPVRATVPLLATFAGLILFFITAPLMQVLGMMSEAMPK